MTATSDRIDLRCAPWTHELGVDPVGSAVRIDRLVTVEVPLPWPADIDQLPWIAAELDPPPGTRMQAIVPEVARADGRVLVNRWDRHGARFRGTDWLVPAVDVPEVLSLVVAGGDPGGGTEAPAELLICGHGARDRCCGNSGTRLAVEARAALVDLRVRRTSHLGGHRFAPTALSLPDGRMWAHLDAEVLVDIAEQRLHPTDARDHYRGHVGLAPWAQVVEAARLPEEGWAAFDVDDLDADVLVDPDGSAAAVTLRWDGLDGPGERSERVVVRRRYPVLQCGLPPEQAKKDAPEYALA